MWPLGTAIYAHCACHLSQEAPCQLAEGADAGTERGDASAVQSPFSVAAAATASGLVDTTVATASGLVDTVEKDPGDLMVGKDVYQWG